MQKKLHSSIYLLQFLLLIIFYLLYLIKVWTFKTCEYSEDMVCLAEKDGGIFLCPVIVYPKDKLLKIAKLIKLSDWAAIQGIMLHIFSIIFLINLHNNELLKLWIVIWQYVINVLIRYLQMSTSVLLAVWNLWQYAQNVVIDSHLGMPSVAAVV